PARRSACAGRGDGVRRGGRGVRGVRARRRAARAASRPARGARPRRPRVARAAAVPELPEVETVRRQLAPLLEGRRLARVEIADVRLTRPFAPDEVARGLEGERVRAL